MVNIIDYKALINLTLFVFSKKRLFQHGTQVYFVSLIGTDLKYMKIIPFNQFKLAA